MIAVDASLVIDVLVASEAGNRAVRRLREAGEALVAPELLDLEVLQVLRRLVSSGRLSQADAEAGLVTYDELYIERFSHRILTGRIWELRDNLTAYDAAYVALAEVLDVELWTRDSKFSDIPGVSARVEVL